MNEPRRRALSRLTTVALATTALACTTTHALRTAPAPGTRVQVDFVTPRDIDVLVHGGRDSVPFDRVSVVTGLVARASADTLWLDHVYVDSARKQIRPGPDATLRVTGVGRDADAREVRFSAVDTTAGVLGIGVGVAALVLVLFLFGPRYDPS